MKEALSSDTVLAYFDPTAEHEVHVDGCPIGIAATLVQKRINDEDWQVVQYASRSLSSAESRYSQIELEMLAVDFGCKKYHMYLYGIPFTIVTDHKPLEFILNNPRHQTSLRLQRIMVRMLDYDFKVRYRPGKDNISDYASRHPVPLTECEKRELKTAKEVKLYVNFIVENDIPAAVKKADMEEYTKKDQQLQALITYIERGSIDKKDINVKSYKDMFTELTTVNGLVMRAERIVVPEGLRGTMVKIAHEGHQGIVRTKQLLRAHVWFPGMDAKVEEYVKKCIACQATTPEHKREPLQMTPLPNGPWKKVSVDFGTIGNRTALVFWDQYTRTPVVEFVPSTSAEGVIPQFERTFTTFGVPEEVKSDNGPPFNGFKFSEYASKQGFRHRKVTPCWPEANGDVERFMRTMKKNSQDSRHTAKEPGTRNSKNGQELQSNSTSNYGSKPQQINVWQGAKREASQQNGEEQGNR